MLVNLKPFMPGVPCPDHVIYAQSAMLFHLNSYVARVAFWSTLNHWSSSTCLHHYVTGAESAIRVIWITVMARQRIMIMNYAAWASACYREHIAKRQSYVTRQ